ncbi:hypothetical protein GLOTRDRAFT_93527 [Gloeophyllum trabeum ATCC 11539]|uniref:Uncharacterized protein n=1 Tax=Gloeophyllum trabeum (strain ATCC 11539 / FP-39264 / Madison 617) TaxID=670483 RepID=S7Q9L7_GLOTA|nr:uncharacterized protein GLOTRDRAFT_93527 [Gloeophyllum trabeum ATCC 11539]EPQ56033.1 hypothetical protein GLOTRDRAFT_93527 [Gloeophyllum trabeum ATCC 11539]
MGLPTEWWGGYIFTVHEILWWAKQSHLDYPSDPAEVVRTLARNWRDLTVEAMVAGGVDVIFVRTHYRWKAIKPQNTPEEIKSSWGPFDTETSFPEFFQTSLCNDALDGILKVKFRLEVSGLYAPTFAWVNFIEGPTLAGVRTRSGRASAVGSAMRVAFVYGSGWECLFRQDEPDKSILAKQAAFYEDAMDILSDSWSMPADW